MEVEGERGEIEKAYAKAEIDDEIFEEDVADKEEGIEEVIADKEGG